MVFFKSIFIKIWSIKVYIYRLSGVYKQLTSPGDGLMLEKSGSVGWECFKDIKFLEAIASLDPGMSVTLRVCHTW
jgi:hypothetical protein